jgi:ABC-2 type transport system ATP-binding protein
VLSEIQQAADQVAVLSDGLIVAEGDVASLRLGRIRRVRASFTGIAAADLRAELDRLPTLRDIDVTGTEPVRVTATIDGDIDPLVKMLARHSVLDLAVEEPDLEESVLQLYGPSANGQNGEVRRG